MHFNHNASTTDGVILNSEAYECEACPSPLISNVRVTTVNFCLRVLQKIMSFHRLNGNVAKGCPPYAVEKQPSMALINLGIK